MGAGIMRLSNRPKEVSTDLCVEVDTTEPRYGGVPVDCLLWKGRERRICAVY